MTAIPRPNSFTAIHRALGLPPQPLDWALIEQAVSSHVREQSDLDWKRERHDTKGDWQDEFAKDVAAMANSGGGLLVLGVNEDRGTAEATGFANSVTLSDGDERKFRSVIYSRVYPPVSGVVFEQLEGRGQSVVVIRVPSSPDAPHLIEKQQLFGAPFRDGTRTEWMRERQLAAAYRIRFAEAADLDRRLSELYDEISVATYADVRVCFVAAAVPEIARPSVLGRIQREEAREIFLDAGRTRSRLCDQGVHPIQGAQGNLFDPRQALRRQTARYDFEDGNPRHRSAMGSVHDNGSVSMAWTLGGMVQRGHGTPDQVAARFVEAAVADFVALTGSTSRTLGIDSQYALQTGLAWEGQEPIVIRVLDYSLTGHDQDAEASIPIRRFIPARTALDPAPDDEQLLTAARDLALDCVSQAGVTHLVALREHLPTS